MLIVLITLGIVIFIWMISMDKVYIKKYKLYSNTLAIYTTILVVTFAILMNLDVWNNFRYIKFL